MQFHLLHCSADRRFGETEDSFMVFFWYLVPCSPVDTGRRFSLLPPLSGQGVSFVVGGDVTTRARIAGMECRRHVN